MGAASAPGTLYDPDTDDVVQAELASEAAAAAREAELRELGTLEQAEPRDGDETVRDELTRRAGGYVDGWLAHALAAHLRHYRDPAARKAAGLMTPPVLAHAALLCRTRPPGPRCRRRPAGVRGQDRHHRARNRRCPR
ncbi:hypothetical protein ACFU8Q_39180 [Streptomyces sp. NPDC057543]|uniref:hypothetical protein n=1 Tax=Streptomyces sp. NPDC057543 TaxID=3346163 RepID=UPI0036C31E83